MKRTTRSNEETNYKQSTVVFWGSHSVSLSGYLKAGNIESYIQAF